MHDMIKGVCILASATAGASAQTTVPVLQDYMTSGFFQSDYIRGEEANSSRDSSRATSPELFGVQGETAYFSFDFQPDLFSGSVPSALFVVETVTTGFFDDPSETNPADISIHSLTEDPLIAIDQDLPSGPGSWIDFRDQQITSSSIVSTSTLDGLGIFEWDVTALVNEWIANGDTNFVYAIGTSALTDSNNETAVAFINSSWSGLGNELTARLVIVPAPASPFVFAALGLVIRRRR